ncbi:MAG: hypothetical protein FWC71_10820, partial [Defluviitaleaceae bacterium]|nr:hypothetical protein [Defluviitaleaceae bacterium]
LPPPREEEPEPKTTPPTEAPTDPLPTDPPPAEIEPADETDTDEESAPNRTWMWTMLLLIPIVGGATWLMNRVMTKKRNK